LENINLEIAKVTVNKIYQSDGPTKTNTDSGKFEMLAHWFHKAS